MRRDASERIQMDVVPRARVHRDVRGRALHLEGGRTRPRRVDQALAVASREEDASLVDIAQRDDDVLARVRRGLREPSHPVDARRRERVEAQHRT